MSGAKRRSKYRKGVRKELLEDLPEPQDGELVAQVKATKGQNFLEIETAEGEVALCLLPTRYRKMVWVKRGTYLIVSEANTGSKGAVSFHVEHVLFEDQVKHLKKSNLWPEHFGAPDGREQSAVAKPESTEPHGSGPGEEETKTAPPRERAPLGYETETDSDDDQDLFVNRNRIPPSDDEDHDESSGDDDDDW